MSLTLHRGDALDQAPHAVLIDLDNTLYAYQPAHQAAMRAVEAKVSQSFGIPADAFLRHFDRARADTKNRLGTTASAHSRLLYFQRTLEIAGLAAQPLMALDLEQTYWRSFLISARLFEGARELLDYFRLRGILVALVTDLTAQIQFRKLIHFGVDRYFDVIVTSEEAGADKPGPVIFEMALAKLKVSGERVWMIGDDARADIGGARQCIRNVVTFQKAHEGVELGTGAARPDVVLYQYRSLVDQFKKACSTH